MEKKSPKRLDRPTFWMWTVPLVVGHVVLTIVLTILGASGAVRSLGAVDTVLIVFLARVLAWRFRDIGWPVWIGPTILLGTMLGLPFLILGYAIASHAGGRIMQWIWLVGVIAGPANIVLLIVAGSVPGKPAPITDVAQVFE